MSALMQHLPLAVACVAILSTRVVERLREARSPRLIRSSHNDRLKRHVKGGGS